MFNVYIVENKYQSYPTLLEFQKSNLSLCEFVVKKRQEKAGVQSNGQGKLADPRLAGAVPTVSAAATATNGVTSYSGVAPKPTASSIVAIATAAAIEFAAKKTATLQEANAEKYGDDYGFGSDGGSEGEPEFQHRKRPGEQLRIAEASYCKRLQIARSDFNSGSAPSYAP